jgi:RimJ/RimL family protein N-acetyltransferase
MVPFGDTHLRDKNYFEWLSDYEVMKTINRLEYLMPVEFEVVVSYVNDLLESDSDIFFALYMKDGDEFIGTVRVAKMDWRHGLADVGILIGNRSAWGRGIATDAINAVSKYLFESLGFRKLTAGALSNNLAVIRAFENNGYVREALFREQFRFENELVDHIYLGCFQPEFRKSTHQN